MSYRNSFCTEYIYDKQDEQNVYDKLSQNWEVYCNSHIISGLIKNTLPLSTPWDLKDILDGVVTNHPVTFVAISENGDYAHTDICVLKNGILHINEFTVEGSINDWKKLGYTDEIAKELAKCSTIYYNVNDKILDRIGTLLKECQISYDENVIDKFINT